jgi:hypothetical protein
MRAADGVSVVHVGNHCHSCQKKGHYFLFKLEMHVTTYPITSSNFRALPRPGWYISRLK